MTVEAARLEQVSDEPPAKEAEAPKPAAIPPEVVQFAEANPWYGKDRRKTALYMAICQELRDAGDTTVGTTFFQKALKKVLLSFTD